MKIIDIKLRISLKTLAEAFKRIMAKKTVELVTSSDIPITIKLEKSQVIFKMVVTTQ